MSRLLLRVLSICALAFIPAFAFQDDEMAPFAGVDAAFERAEAALEAIEQLPPDARTFENTVLAIDGAWSRLFTDVGYPRFLAEVHPSAEVRERAEALKERLSNWFTELLMREELYRAVSDYGRVERKLAPEEARLLAELQRDFKRAGMALGAEGRARMKAIDFELTELGQDFSKNIRDDETVVALSAEELAGNPPERLAQLERSGDLYLVPTIASVMSPIVRDCEVSATRHKLLFAYDRRGGTRNIALLEKILALR